MVVSLWSGSGLTTFRLIVFRRHAAGAATSTAPLRHDIGQSTSATRSRRRGQTRFLGFDLALPLGLFGLANTALFLFPGTALGGEPGFFFDADRVKAGFFLPAGCFLDGETLVASRDQGAVFGGLRRGFRAGKPLLHLLDQFETLAHGGFAPFGEADVQVTSQSVNLLKVGDTD